MPLLSFIYNKTSKMECEVCLAQKPTTANILRIWGLNPGHIRTLLKEIGFELRESAGSVDLVFSSPEDLRRAKELLGSAVYSEGEPMEEVVGNLLRKRKMTLSCAESCTGGLVGARIVNIPGSSDYFVGGVIAYSNRLKVELLGVREETLSRFGAVSEQTCGEMLEGLRERFKTEAGIAITGIAGPGGTENKPEGLTYIGVFLKDRKVVEEHIFEGTRNEKRFASSQTALNTLRLMLLEEEI